jgi:hypothetical protein
MINDNFTNNKTLNLSNIHPLLRYSFGHLSMTVHQSGNIVAGLLDRKLQIIHGHLETILMV